MVGRFGELLSALVLAHQIAVLNAQVVGVGVATTGNHRIFINSHMRFRLINQSLGALVLPFLAEFLLVLLFSQLYNMTLDAYKIGLCSLDCVDARKNLTRRLVRPFDNRILLFFSVQFGFKHI